jgi:hypothetical protein
MAQTIKLKRSGTQNAVPSTSQLALGEVALNTYDGKMYIKKSVGGTESIVEIGGDATSSSGLDFTGNLNLADNVRIVIGDGNDLQIYHDGSDSIINENGTGDLKVFSSRFRVISPAGEEMIRATADGAVDLYHNNSAKFATTSAGAQITGKLFVSDTSNGLEIGASKARFKVNGDDTVIDAIPTGGGINFRTGGAVQAVKIDSDGRLLVNTTSSIDNFAKIQVVGDSSSLARITLQDVDGTNQKTYFEQSGGGTRINTQNGTSNGFFTIGAWDGTTSSDFLRVTADGRVGIGTTSPSRIFHVEGANVGIATSYGVAVIEAVDSQLDLISNSSGTWGSAINLVEGVGTSNTDVWSIARQTTGGSGNSSLRFNFGTTNQHTNPNKVTFTGDGKVGIGTDSPLATLDVRGDIELNSTYPVIRFKDSDSENDFSIIGGSGLFRIYDEDAAAARIAINSSGNVGIGTTSPSKPLHVVGAARVTGDFQVEGGDIEFNQSSGQARIRNLLQDTYMRFQVNVGGTQTNAINIRGNNAYVGIGSAEGGSSPVYPLDVYNAGADTVARFTSGDDRARIQISDDDTEVFVIAEGSKMSLGAANSLSSTNLTIDASGSLGIGTTSPAGNLHIKSLNNVGDATLIIEADADNNFENDNPRIELRQDNNLVGGYIYLEGNAATTAVNTIANSLILDAKASSTAGSHSIQFATGGLAPNQSGGPTNSSVRMTITDDGKVGIGTTSPGRKLTVQGATGD